MPATRMPDASMRATSASSAGPGPTSAAGVQHPCHIASEYAGSPLPLFLLLLLPEAFTVARARLAATAMSALSAANKRVAATASTSFGVAT